MRRTLPAFLALLAGLALATPARSQRPRPAQPAAAPAAQAAQPSAADSAAPRPSPRMAGPAGGAGPGAEPREESSVTEHTLRLGGQTVAYRATAATMLLRNDSGAPVGSLYYTAYTRTDAGSDRSRRPLAFVYNGGPGSASAWLHMGAFGPRRVVTPDAAFAPPAPYQVVDNASSLIDVADLVFLDPIGTGFSRPVGRGQGRDFWGLDEDAAALAQFIYAYVSRNGRWNSPKYLIGESYGTTRSAVLVNRLQSREGMDFNGVVLISSILDFETTAFAPGHDISYVLYLPSYAATAAYHGLIPRPQNLAAFLDEVRRFALTEYQAALDKGSALGAEEMAAVRTRLARYTGLSEEYLTRANLRVSLRQWMAELNRARGQSTGRLDARFTGPLRNLLSESGEGDPQSNAVTGAYTAAINGYLRDELRFGGGGDQRYSLSGGVTWNWNRAATGGPGGGGGRNATPYVGGDLAAALAYNPNLRVEVENGYYDMATPFFATEYTMDHLGIAADLRSHIALKYYEAGHMMYLHEPDLAALKANIAQFIAATSRGR
jgi:carboxypeptidase C (cathepsin A)